MATPAPGKKFAKKVGNRTVSYGDVNGTIKPGTSRNVGGASIVGLGIRPDMSYVYLANNTNTGITSIFNILEYIQI